MPCLKSNHKTNKDDYGPHDLNNAKHWTTKLVRLCFVKSVKYHLPYPIFKSYIILSFLWIISKTEGIVLILVIVQQNGHVLSRTGPSSKLTDVMWIYTGFWKIVFP